MTEQFSKIAISDAARLTSARQDVSVFAGPGTATCVSVPPRRAAQLREGACVQAVQDAGLDLLLLYDGGQVPNGVDALQVLLRTLCASGRKVDRVQLQDGHITLDVDGTALAIGGDRLPDRRNGVFFRPEGPGHARASGRLGYFLYRHKACLRLRIGATASAELSRDLLSLLLDATAPKAAVLLDTRIVLSLSEVLALPPDALSRLAPGQIVPRPVARYARPSVPGAPTHRADAKARRDKGGALADKLVGQRLALREQAGLREALRRPSASNGASHATGRGKRRMAACCVLALSIAVWFWVPGGKLF